LNELSVFPTIFYETQIDKDLSLEILKEIKDNQQIVDIISESTQPHPVSDYSTDYAHPLYIKTFWERVVPGLNQELSQFNFTFDVLQSWIACYTGPAGHHPLHNHVSGYDGNIPISGILYLTEVGFTDFFNVSVISQNNTFHVKSEVGKIILFPSIIPHQYRSESYDGNSRYVLPFNGHFKQLQS
jgi:hypothetical protein